MVTTHKDANMRCCRALDMIDRSSPDQEEQKISRREEDGKGLYGSPALLRGKPESLALPQ